MNVAKGTSAGSYPNPETGNAGAQDSETSLPGVSADSLSDSAESDTAVPELSLPSQPFQVNGHANGEDWTAPVAAGDDVKSASPAPRCPRCNVETPAGADNCPACGGFLRANKAARRHDAYARVPPASLRMNADELVAGIVSDHGGVAEMSTIERSYAKKLGDLEILCRALAGDLATRGLITPGGRVRDSYAALITGLATFDRYAGKLGMKRRQKHVVDLARVLSGQEAR